jgi:hypothetical protein
MDNSPSRRLRWETKNLVSSAYFLAFHTPYSGGMIMDRLEIVFQNSATYTVTC